MRKIITMGKRIMLSVLLIIVQCLWASAVHAMGSAPPTPTQEVEIMERIATQTEEVKSQEKYEMKTLMEIPWGSKQGELGVKAIEGNVFAPERLIIDDSGKIYILDTVNNKVQKYHKNGEYIGSIGINSFEMKKNVGILPKIVEKDKSIDIDEKGNVYVFDINKNMAKRIDITGKIVQSYTVPEERRDPKAFKVDEIGGLSKGGVKTRSGLTVVLEKENNEDCFSCIKILDSAGKLLKRITVTDKNPIWEVIFKGSDRKGNLYFYITKETGEIRQVLTSPGTYFPMRVVGSFIYKYNSNGILCAEIPVSRNVGWVAVDSSGNIYELKMEGSALFSGEGAPLKKFIVLKYEQEIFNK